MLVRRLLSGFLVFAFVASAVNATTLIAFRDANSVVLAADSKVLPFKSQAPPTTQSKILRCGKYFVAVAGIDYMVAANIRFDIQYIIASACKPKQTPVQAMNAIRSRLDANYSRILDALALVEPSYVRALAVAKEKELAENLILVGSHNGIPFILTHNLVPYLEYGKIRVKASGSMHNNRLKNNVVQFALGGVYADVRTQIDKQADDLPTSNLVQTARFLIDYQITKIPEASGYPIEIVEITAKGKVSCLYCDPQCAAKQVRTSQRESYSQKRLNFQSQSFKVGGHNRHGLALEPGLVID